MKNKQAILTYVVFLFVNAAIMTCVFKLSLGPVLTLLTGELNHVSIFDALCCAIVLMALRGMFIIKMETD